jgi:hypothetical protein
MRIIRVCLVGILAVVLESVLCIGRFTSHVLNRVAALFSGLFLLSAVVAMIQHGGITHLAATSLLGVLLCVIIPILFGVLVEGLGMLEDRMCR